jgi:predicted unusual protein kinase regulating ubiquinone biosynthesis (AarF/ABC1/UbiB family)
VLASLQDDTPCVSWAFVKPQLIKALGLEAVNQLNIDPEPIAAASLGQVHLATIKNSQQKVVVKIQYPGIADAISNDVATLKRLLGATRLVPKALDLSQVFNELQDMLERECDYVREREFTETFFKHLKADSRFVVPEVHAEYCADRVLTTTYQPGFSVASKEVQALSQERRNQLGQAFVDLFVREFFEWNTVQTDPHFGNYRVQIDPNGQQDKIVVFDFGATRQFTKVFVNQYTQIVKGALDCDRDLIASAVVKIGLMSHSTPQAVLYEFGELAELIVEPFRKSFHKMVPEHLYSTSGAYRFGVTDLPVRVGQTAASKMMSVHFKIPPKEIVFLHRRIAGVLVTLRVLGSELRLGELLSPYLYR